MVKCNEPGFESDQGWSPVSAPSLMIDHSGGGHTELRGAGSSQAASLL